MFKLNKQKQESCAGFTLIEVVVAISILTIAFISLVQSFPFGSSINKSAQQQTVASYLAQSKIEDLYSQGYDNIATGTVEARHRLSSDTDNYLYNYARETEINYVNDSLNTVSSDTGLKKITTRVFYQNSISKNEKSLEVDTLISKH